MQYDTLIDQQAKIQDWRTLDRQFSRFIAELYPEQPALALAGGAVSRALVDGHICLPIDKPLSGFTAEQWEKWLGDLACLEQENDSPIVKDGAKLYLRRYWQYENQVSERILVATIGGGGSLDPEYSDWLSRLFPEAIGSDTLDWQLLAAAVAMGQRFTVISGGPGTGKTTTVVKLLGLAVMDGLKQKGSVPIIRLAAPTGKAAQRLTESINGALTSLNLEEDVRQAIPNQADTLHRLLKRRSDGSFLYHAGNPLHLDLLVVDEASMIDLPMMAKLLAAMPKHGRLILLGDMDQLASVEAGSVMADICDSGQDHGISELQIQRLRRILPESQVKALEGVTGFVEPNGSPIRDNICRLRKSYRFDDQSGIGHLARAANQSDVAKWNEVIGAGYEDLAIYPLGDLQHQQFLTLAKKEYRKVFDAMKQLHLEQRASSTLNDDGVLTLHRVLSQFQVLCAVKQGPLGVETINATLDRFFRATYDRQWAASLMGEGWQGQSQTWYPGRPVMMLENDYGLNLYNGDIGIALPWCDPLSGEWRLKVAFVQDHVKWIQPSRLPKHETVYAMTVHKSQGSEFDHVGFVLPDTPSPILTKELLYTGITRAKSRLTLLLRDTIAQNALTQKVARTSGLRDKLWSIQSESTPLIDEGSESQFSLFDD